MNQFFKKILAFNVMIAAIWAMPSPGNAQEQIIDTGTVVENMTFTDIKGNKINLYEYLAQGYMVVLDLGLTTCTICWHYHTTGLLERVYKKYGPNGSVTPKKIMPIFIECNPNTNRADLNGTGTNTVGDWVTGVSYPVVDLTQEAKTATINKFFKNTTSFSTPTFLVICPDGKLIYSSQGMNADFEEALLTKLMKGRCAMGETLTTSVENVAPATSVTVYPNPVADVAFIHGAGRADMTLFNIEGRFVRSAANAQEISLSGLPHGLYLLHITDKDGHIIKIEKLLKK